MGKKEKKIASNPYRQIFEHLPIQFFGKLEATKKRS